MNIIDEKFDPGIPVTVKYYNKEEKHSDLSEAVDSDTNMLVTIKGTSDPTEQSIVTK